MWRFGGNGLGYYIFTLVISLTCHTWYGSDTWSTGSDTWWGWIEYRQPRSNTICVDWIRVRGVDWIPSMGSNTVCFVSFSDPIFLPLAMAAWFHDVWFFFLCRRWSNTTMQGIQEVFLHEFKGLGRLITVVADLLLCLKKLRN